MKKFIAILAAFVLTFFVVSCGGGSDEPTNPTDPTDNPTNPTDEPTNPTDPTDEPTNPTEPNDEPTEPTEPTNIEPGECPVITIGAMKNDGSYDSYAYYSGSYAPNTGAATADEIDFEIYSETATGTYDLTEGYNVSYSSCAQCILVYEDIIYDNEGYFEGAGKYYYPASGTITVNSFSYDSGSLNITLENIKLIQVTREYDSESDRFKSEPVENGSCLVIQDSILII